MNRDVTPIAVLGSYRGGTSAVSQVLSHLGCFLGDAFVNAWNGYWTYEDVFLRRLALQCFDEREQHWRLLGDYQSRVELLARWKTWSRERTTALSLDFVAGKHPTMCKFVPELVEAWSSDSASAPRLISVARDVDTIISSWRRSKSPKGVSWWPRGDIEILVPDLIQSRDASLQNYEHLVVDFDRLRREPISEIEKIADYCGIPAARVDRAALRFKTDAAALAEGQTLVVGMEHGSRPDVGKPPPRLPGLQTNLSRAFFDLKTLRRLPPPSLDEILCVMIVFNESLRLPDTLRHYRSLGVDRFAVIDNASDDRTQALLLDQPDCDVYFMPHEFRTSIAGSGWSSTLIREFYGTGRWVVCSDADEQLVFDDCERHDLHDLSRYLTLHGQDAFPCVMVDMYSERGVLTSVLEPGQRLADCCRVFDGEGYQRLEHAGDAGQFPRVTWSGGPMERLLGAPCGWLAKVPFMFWDADTWNWNPHVAYPFDRGFSRPGGALLHFKWLSDLPANVSREIARNQHANNAYKYRLFGQAISLRGDICLMSERSRQYEGSHSLLNTELIDSITWDVSEHDMKPSKAPTFEHETL